MTEADRITLLRQDLQNPPAASDAYLSHLLKTAEERIFEEGIQLTDSTGDEDLRIMYAAYLYRKRGKDDNPMPRMLRYALNNRLFSQKGAVIDAVR